MSLVLVGHPFDTMKVRLQIEGKNGRFKGPLHCIFETAKTEGIRGFYKGVTPPLFATGIINSILFGLQGVVTHSIKEIKGGDTTRSATVKETAGAAIITGALISTIVTPMEGIKSRLQVQYNSGTTMYAGPLDCAKKILKTSGASGLYRGFGAVCLCRMSNWSYFGSYELFRQYLSNQPHGGQGRSKMSFGASVLSGGLAGICYWLSCYPIDVIKARIMTNPNNNYLSIRDAASMIYKSEGPKAFFRGFTPCILRAFPANAACFVAFEAVMSMLPE